MSEEPPWVGVGFRHLAALKAIADGGSFGRAGARLGYAQSTISQQIAALEQAVGHRLVDRVRGGGGVQITEAGRVLLSHSDAIFFSLAAAANDVSAIKNGVSHQLRIGLSQSIAARIFPEVARRFRAERPDVRLVPIESAADSAIYGAIESHHVDVGFVDLPAPPGPFELSEVLIDPFLLIARREPGIATSLQALDELSGIPMVGHNSCRALERIDAQLRSEGIGPEIVVRSDVNATIQALVGAGIGVAILTELSFDPDDPLTTGHPLPEIPPRVIAIVRHRDRSANDAADAFAETVQAVCRPMSDARSLKRPGSSAIEAQPLPVKEVA